MKFSSSLFLLSVLAVTAYAHDNTRESKKSGRKSHISHKSGKSGRKSVHLASETESLSLVDDSVVSSSAAICAAELQAIVYAPPSDVKDYLSGILKDVLATLQPFIDPINNTVAIDALKQIAKAFNISITLQSAIPTATVVIRSDGTVTPGLPKFGRVVDPTYLNDFGFVKLVGNTYQISGSLNNCNGYVLVIITSPSEINDTPTPGPDPG